MVACAAPKENALTPSLHPLQFVVATTCAAKANSVAKSFGPEADYFQEQIMSDFIFKSVAALFIIVCMLAFWQVVRERRKAKLIDETVSPYEASAPGLAPGKCVDVEDHGGQ